LSWCERSPYTRHAEVPVQARYSISAINVGCDPFIGDPLEEFAVRKCYFHLRSNDVIDLEDGGAEFDLDGLAVEEAERAARGMMVDAVVAKDGPLDQQFEIMRDAGTVIGVVKMEVDLKRIDSASTFIG
jgi:hypothetical protein